MVLRGAQRYVHPVGATIPWIALFASLLITHKPAEYWGFLAVAFAIFWLIWLFVLPKVDRVI